MSADHMGNVYVLMKLLQISKSTFCYFVFLFMETTTYIKYINNDFWIK